MSTVRTLKARYVFPARGEPIADGADTIADGRIVRVGKADGQGALEDLGNVALLPGFVNAHTHLDLSQLDRPLGAPGDGMAAWIRRVIEFRRGPGGSRALAVERGLRESIAGGVTTLGDIVQPGGEWPATTGPSPDATRFLELIAPTAARVAPMLKEARRYLEQRQRAGEQAAQHADLGIGEAELRLPDRQHHIDEVGIAVMGRMRPAGDRQRAPLDVALGIFRHGCG